MKTKLAASAFTVVALVGTILVAPPASAATAPAWETGPNTLFPNATGFPNLDPNSKGGLKFYDSTGTEIWQGSDLTHIADYISTTGTIRRKFAGSGADNANVTFALPDHNKPNTTTWTNLSLAGSQIFPLVSPAPANLLALDPDVPVASLGVNEGNIQSPLQTAVLDKTDGYANLLQIRVYDTNYTGPQTGVNAARYFWSADIEFNTGSAPLADGLAAGSWQVVFPAPPAPPAQVTTSLADLTPSPASGATAPVSLSLSTTVSATDSSHPAGSVHFFDGVTDLGAATSWDAATGAASITGVTPSVGSHSYTAVFTPTDATTYAPSTSNALTYSVVAGSSTIATSVGTIAPTVPTKTNTPVVLGLSTVVSAVGGSHPDGSVHFFDGTTDLGVAAFTPATGAATISGLSPAVGTHSYTAVFTPSDSTTYAPSTSPALPYEVLPLKPESLGNGTLATGSHAVGGTLNCVKGAWANSPTSYKYTWWANSVQFAADKTSVVLTASQLGKSVVCRVTAANHGGSRYDDSLPVMVVRGTFTYTTKPSISGVFKVGKTLTAQSGKWNPSVTPTYVWKRGSVVIGRAKTYKTTPKDKGKILTLVVTVKRTGYNDKSVSVNSRRIG
jgi:hypothetical protein